MEALAYERVGDATRPSLLLLHGFMSSRHQWLANLDALGDAFQLVLVELWGHGRSPEPTDPAAWSVEEYIRQFERIRRRLDIDAWGLVGQSYGAGLVLSYALERPDVCPAVVVTNSRSAFGKIDRERRGGNAVPREPLTPRDLPLHPINARRFPDHVKAALVRDADKMSMIAIQMSGRLAPELNFTDRLGLLRQPIMLANGLYEKAFQADVEVLKARYPALEVVDLEGGHSVNIEAAERFNLAVADFFARHLKR